MRIKVLTSRDDGQILSLYTSSFTPAGRGDEVPKDLPDLIDTQRDWQGLRQARAQEVEDREGLP